LIKYHWKQLSLKNCNKTDDDYYDDIYYTEYFIIDFGNYKVKYDVHNGFLKYNYDMENYKTIKKIEENKNYKNFYEDKDEDDENKDEYDDDKDDDNNDEMIKNIKEYKNNNNYNDDEDEDEDDDEDDDDDDDEDINFLDNYYDCDDIKEIENFMCEEPTNDICNYIFDNFFDNDAIDMIFKHNNTSIC